MNWWTFLRRKSREGWTPGRAQADAKDRRAAPESRWVVVDVEASGLDASADRLLAIAGVAVRFRAGEPRLQIADSFEVILRQEEGAVGGALEIDRSNILLHGIGIGAQRGGVPAVEALAAFKAWAVDSPIIGYHAAFDQTLIQRYCARYLGQRLDNEWADLEHVVLLTVPDLSGRSLDAAMERLGIACPKRHQAAADSLATAEVLLKVWPLARAQMGGRVDIKAFRRLAARHHWLPRA